MEMAGHDDSDKCGTKRKHRYGSDSKVSSDIDTTAALGLIPTMASGPLAVSGDDHYYKNLYLEKELDFRLLGERDSEFQAVLERGSHLNFADPKSVMQLTKTLLRLDFGLLVDLPMDRLCPPVPNRHNYILWLKDLIDSTSPLHPDFVETARQVTGLDIGTGASLIYPLLGCVQRPSWSFVATDVDSKSLAYARKNAQLNNMDSRIRVVDRTTTDSLVPLADLGLETIDFVMVNPPFYTSEEELVNLASQKSRPPNSACTGAPIEMVCAGGEISFVRRIIDESLVLKGKVQWYTAMLGKQSSLEVLVGILKGHGVTNYAITTFVQGNKTRRWAVGWSFKNLRPSLLASRGCEPSAGKKILPLPTEATVGSWPISRVKPAQLERAICEMMENIDLASWIWDRSHSRGIGFADGNVWGRSYRRKRARKEKEDTGPHGEGTTEINQPSSLEMCRQRAAEHGLAHYALGFCLSIRDSKDIINGEGQCVIVARWLQGNDHALFESFTGLLKRSIRLG